MCRTILDTQKLLLIAFISVFIVSSSQGQSKATIIGTIRRDFTAINADKTLLKKTLSDEELVENVPDGGAELSGYYKGKTLVKMVEWIGLSYGNRTREFYLKKGKLFFVYEKFESFVDSGDQLDHSRVKTSFEGRYYFEKDKLIEQKIAGHRTLDDPHVDIPKELLESVKEHVDQLNKKR